MTNQEKLAQLFQDETFAEEVKTLSTAEDLQDLFEKHDVTMTLDEVYDLCGAIARQVEAEQAGGELPEEDLEAVSGGSWIIAGIVVLGVACLGAFAVGVYNGYKSAKPAHT